MKNLFYLAFNVLRMPIMLIILGLAGGIMPFTNINRNIILIIAIIMISILVFIQFFTDKYFFWRGMQTAFFGFVMLFLLLNWGYDSNAWVITMQIIGFGGAAFFCLDIDEQLKNYKRFLKKPLSTLVHPSIYKKLATSRCSVDMYTATLDQAYKRYAKKENNGEKLLQARMDIFSAKEEMNYIYKRHFFFPKTKIQLWRKKLNDLIGKNPRRRRIKRLNK